MLVLLPVVTQICKKKVRTKVIITAADIYEYILHILSIYLGRVPNLVVIIPQFFAMSRTDVGSEKQR